MKKIILAITFMLLSNTLWALRLPHIFADHMVLQQQTDVKIWGWASAGATVTIATDWNTTAATTTANEQGSWALRITTPAASFTPHTLTLQADGTTLTLQDILIGEVWFCSGQSNMEMPLGGFWNCPVEGAAAAIAQSGKYRHAIRVATIPKVRAELPQQDVACHWDICTPVAAPSFTACGYFFATTIVDMLQVPVGIINCSWGGSCVEGWMPREILLTYPDGLVPMDDTDYHEKMVMYNGMLHPLAGYTIRGFLWNQGESNVGQEQAYIERFSAMITHWRTLWEQPNDPLPVYSVELPAYIYGNGESDFPCPAFRAAQHAITRTLPHSGCVATSDLIYPYELNQIHGCRKREIGERLAYMAAAHTYGVAGVEADAPELSAIERHTASGDDVSVIAGSVVAAQQVSGTVYRLYFDHAFDGFDRMDNIDGFEVQSADGIWHPAIVWAACAWNADERPGCFLKLACPEVAEAKAIRYAYKNFITTQLHNLRGLPVVPFMQTLSE